MPPASVEATVAKHDKANVLFIVFVPPDNLPGRSLSFTALQAPTGSGKILPGLLPGSPVCKGKGPTNLGKSQHRAFGPSIAISEMSGRKCRAQGENFMLYTIAVILVILWLLGMVTSYTVGGLIHILLALAIISVLIRVIQGRNPL
jgi:hypothetical protein